MAKFKNLKPGEVLSESQYYKVVKTKGDKVQMITDSGENVVLEAKYVDTFLTSASQFTTATKTVTKSELSHIITSKPRSAMTINYNKQVKPEDVVANIMSTYKDTPPAKIEASIKKIVKSTLEGEEHTIVGRHNHTFDAGGRLQFVDMEVEPKTGAYDPRQRLVDLRTLNWAIVDEVKYVVK